MARRAKLALLTVVLRRVVPAAQLALGRAALGKVALGKVALGKVALGKVVLAERVVRAVDSSQTRICQC